MKRYFTMLELVCALGCLSILLAVFYTLQTNLKRAEQNFNAETAAILVMQNTLERLRMEERPNPATARRIFLEESLFAPMFTPEFQESGNQVHLALLNKKQIKTVEIFLTCEK